jgi:hypothetical protein
MPYTPKYISDLDEVPVTGPDPYDTSAKMRAVKQAESKLEADVNDGSVIDPNDREDIHGFAANAYASYLLALGPKAPDSMLGGDLADEGSDRTTFAEHLRQMYYDARDSIIAAADDAGDGATGGSQSQNADFNIL